MSRRLLLASAFATAMTALATGCTDDTTDWSDDDVFTLPSSSRSAEHSVEGWPVRVEPNSNPPALVDGTLYCSEYGGRIRAFDGISGRELWRVDPDEGLASLNDVVQDTPLVTDGILVVGRHSASPGASAVIALDAGKGTKLWSVPVRGGLSVVIQGTQVVLAENLPRKAGRLWSGSMIRTLDARSGDVIWERRSPSVHHLFADEAALYAVYTADSNDRGFRALRPGDGREVWRRQAVVSDATAVPISGGVVVVAETYTDDSTVLVKGLRASSGDTLWENKYRSMTANPVLGQRGRLLLSPDQTVQSLDMATGARLWSYQSPTETLYSLLESNGTVICGEYEQASPEAMATGIRINLLDADTGKPKAAWDGDYTGAEILAAAYGLAYVRGYREEGMELICLDTSSGKQLWKSAVEGGATVAAANEALYVLGTELRRLDPRTGRRL